MLADNGPDPQESFPTPDGSSERVSLPLRWRNRATITPDRIFRTVLWSFALASVVLLVWTFSGIIFYLLIGMLVAFMTSPLVDRIQHVGIHRTFAILLSFLLVFSGLSLLLTWLVPLMGSQLGELTQRITADTVAEWATAIEVSIRRFLPIVPEGTVHAGFARVAQQLFAEAGLATVITYMVDLFTNLLFAVLIVPIVAFFLLKDALLLRRRLMHYVPNRFFEIGLGLIEKVQSRIGRYISGLLIQIVVVSITASIALVFTDLEYPLVLGIFTGVANTIPYFGPIAGFAAGTLMALGQTGDFSLVPGLIIAMSITQFIDNSFYQPFIFSRAVRTHPLVILFVVLIGAQLNGIVGMLLALPITTALLVTFEQVIWSIKNYRLLSTG
ncbi:MAG: AI-2E family transporter [Rhodothermales bacterium]|nr:AI-2E family transporter [Rhodothermales bacterium]